MPEYTIRDPQTGKTVTVRGDSPPSESELEDIFKSVNGTAPAAEPDSAVSRFASGAWKNLNPIAMLEGLGSAAMHPLDTAKAIGQSQIAQFGKAADDYRQGHYSEMLGHGAAGALPILGPAAASAGERIGSGDVAGGLGEGTGLLAPFLAPTALRAAKPAVAATVGAARALPGGSGALDALAQLADRASTSRVVDAIAPKVGPNKVRLGQQAAKVAPELARADDLGALSRAGLATKVDAKLAAAEDALDSASDSRLVSQQVPTGPILAKLDEQLGKLTAQPLEGSRTVPSVVGDAVREVPVNPLRQYALRWMKDEMESFPFVKRTWNEKGAGPLDGNAAGGHADIVAGAGGAPIYNAITGAGVKATRAQVTAAIEDVLNGKTGGALRQRVVDAADALVSGDRNTVKLMQTSGPAPMNEPMSRLLALTKDVPAEAPGVEGRPLGQPVEPMPSADETGVLRQIRNEVAQLGPVAPYESIRRIRQAWDQVAKVKYSPSLTQDFLKKQGEATAAMKGTGAMRDALAAADPTTAAANADYSLYKTASDVLRATEETEAARPRVGRRIMRVGGGTLVGEGMGGATGAALGATLAVILDGASNLGLTTKIMTARKLAQVADLLRGGNQAQAQSLVQQIARELKQAPSKGAMVRETAGPMANILGSMPATAAADGTAAPQPAVGRR